MGRTVLKIFLPVYFLCIGNSFGVSNQQRIERSLCSINFEYDGWKDKTHIGKKEAVNGYSFLLSNESIFELTKQLNSGKEVLHKGKTPKEIQPLKIDFRFWHEDKIGWKGHEKFLLSISINDSSSSKLLAGPWVASTIRNRESYRENRSPEGMPALQGSLAINGKLLKIASSCGVALN